MSENLEISKSQNRVDRYETLLKQIPALFLGEDNFIANISNLNAVLKETFNWLWVGVYIKDENDLVLGPFQGPLACTRIPFSKGVCGKAFESQKTIIVPDVNKFPGHIACSALSKSEIVIPGMKDNQCLFVLDVDSDKPNDFGTDDQKYLEKMIAILIESSLLQNS